MYIVLKWFEDCGERQTLNVFIHQIIHKNVIFICFMQQVCNGDYVDIALLLFFEMNR